MSYEQKYIKYKTKYLQLKNMYGGDNTQLNTTIKKLFDELVSNFIVPVYLEIDCCLNDISRITAKNTYQAAYLLKLKSVFKKYNSQVNETFDKVFNTTKENVITELSNKLNNVNVDNMKQIIDQYIWPLSTSIISNYMTMYNEITEFCIKNKIPYYLIKITKDLKRTKEELICTNIKNIKSCCDTALNASNCVLLIGGQRIPRLGLLLKEIIDRLSKNNADGKYTTLINYIKEKNTYVTKSLVIYNDRNGEMEKRNEELFSNKDIKSKIQNQKFGGIDITAQPITVK